jgi:predicted Zn-dependent protease
VTIILRMSELGAEAESAVERSADADLVRSVELRARTLLDVGDVREARAVVQEALEASGDHADLLWMLADIEFTAGDVVAGRSCLMEAVAVNGNDAAVIARWIGALRRGGKAGQD